MELTGLVLAGGTSSRMGRDKALLDWDGERLVDRVARRLAEVCAEVLVASGDGVRLPVDGTRQVADALAGAGPLAGIVAGLEAAAHPLVAVAAVDMPDADPVLLRRLAMVHDGHDAVVPRAGGRLQPLHAVWSVTAAPRVRALLDEGVRGVHDALDGLRVLVVVVDGGGFARNLNEPSDLGA